MAFTQADLDAAVASALHEFQARDAERFAAARQKIARQFGAKATVLHFTERAIGAAPADDALRITEAHASIRGQLSGSSRVAPAVTFRAEPGVDRKLWSASFTAAVRFSAASAGDRRFSGVAYGGGVIMDHPTIPRVAFELSSTTFTTPAPALFNHDPDAPVGVIESATLFGNIKIAGKLFTSLDQLARDIANKADRGMPWQLSVRIRPGKIDEVASGYSARVNGNMVPGPLTIYRDNSIREVSFCVLGADDRTSVTLDA